MSGTAHPRLGRLLDPDSGKAGLIHLCFSSPGAPGMFGRTQAHAAPCWHAGSQTRRDLSHSTGERAHAHTYTCQARAHAHMCALRVHTHTCVCPCMCAHVHMCVRARVYTCVHACVHAHTHTGHTLTNPLTDTLLITPALWGLCLPHPAPPAEHQGSASPVRVPSSPDIAGSASSQSQSD